MRINAVFCDGHAEGFPMGVPPEGADGLKEIYVSRGIIGPLVEQLMKAVEGVFVLGALLAEASRRACYVYLCPVRIRKRPGG